MKKVFCLLLALTLLLCFIGCSNNNSSEPSVTSSPTSSTVSEPPKASPYEQLCEFIKTNGTYATNESYEYTYELSGVMGDYLDVQLQPNGQIRFSILGDFSTGQTKAETLIYLDFVDGASSLKISYAMQIDIIGYLAEATINKSTSKENIELSIGYEDTNDEYFKSTCREMFEIQANHLMSQIDTFLIANVDICLYDLGFYNFPKLT